MTYKIKENGRYGVFINGESVGVCNGTDWLTIMWFIDIMKIDIEYEVDQKNEYISIHSSVYRKENSVFGTLINENTKINEDEINYEYRNFKTYRKIGLFINGSFQGYIKDSDIEFTVSEIKQKYPNTTHKYNPEGRYLNIWT